MTTAMTGATTSATTSATLPGADAPPVPARLAVSRLPAPVGELTVVTDERGAVRLLGAGADPGEVRTAMARRYPGVPLGDDDAPTDIAAALARYFDGDLAALDGIPTAAAGTPFQRAVWAALREIPAGTTASYRDIAVRLGSPGAVRAVGMANGANPVAIVVPCHRVIGADGSLTGYAGGMARKRWLLAHEGVALAGDALAPPSRTLPLV
jgi:O-6-methylguanine DNA methyltransferase